MPSLTRRELLQSAGAVGGAAFGGTAFGRVLTGPTKNAADAPGRERKFLGTWTASPQAPYEQGISQQGFEDETVRLPTRTSIGGDGVRLRFANSFGSESVTFDHVTVGVRDSGATVASGTLRDVTFGGDTEVTIPAGGRVLSDPVSLSVAPEQDLVTSVYVADATGPTTWHALPTKTSYISEAGDHAGETSGSAFTTTTTHWFYLEGVEVVAPDTVGSIVCLGNSITDGYASTIDANAAYPDFLAERVNERNSLHKSVLNAGISGNRVLHDSACCGVNALARFDRDVLTQPDVTDVILLEGINDIGFSEIAPSFTSVTAAEIIDGMQQLVARAHSHDVRIFGGTLTPFEGAGYYYPAGEEKRQAVNDFIRNSGEFDGVIDFDAAIRDPDDPTTILDAYDSGDHLHPNDSGYEAMADAIELQLFEGRGSQTRSALDGIASALGAD